MEASSIVHRLCCCHFSFGCMDTFTFDPDGCGSICEVKITPWVPRVSLVSCPMLCCPPESGGKLPLCPRRYAPLPHLRSHEEAKEWLRSHSAGGLQDSASDSPFSPGSSLTSPSGTRFNFAQLGTPPPHPTPPHHLGLTASASCCFSVNLSSQNVLFLLGL